MKYNNLSNTGLLVSELCFGAMTFGGKGRWTAIGQQTQDEANSLMKTAIDHGINFFDNANAYSEGLAEEIMGTALKQLNVQRDTVVIATKLLIRMGPGANQVGLSRAHIYDSVEASLKRLQLDHIDLLYIHGVDKITPLEETMRGLEDVVRSGKVRYIGVCNQPAYRVVKANAIAEKMGWTKFKALQYYYALASRDIEHTILPMALEEGLSVLPWSPLAGGFLSGKFDRNTSEAGNSRRDNFDFPPLSKEKAYDIIDVMREIAKERGVSVAQIALKWVMRQNGVDSTIIGAKNEKQLLDNLNTVNWELSDTEMTKLNEVSALPTPYPNWMVEFQTADRVIKFPAE
jgi:aryl-alcohol dehydrogenase-like predicted oxidoreductase